MVCRRFPHQTPLALLALGLCLGLVFSPETLRAQEPGDPEGLWYGTLRPTPSLSLRMVLEIHRNGSSEGESPWTAVLVSLDQSGEDIPARLTVEGRNLKGEVFLGTRLLVSLEGSIDGPTMDLEFLQGTNRIPLPLTRVSEVPGFRRSQTVAWPVPYRSLEVRFPSPRAGITLAGTLTLPMGASAATPVPAVVLVTGSGPQDRNESMLLHRPFLIVSDYLTRRGYAVLRFDDRGVWGSGGAAYPEVITEDNKDDALAAFDYLRSRPEVAWNQVGILGHSEGALVAAMAAAERQEVAFIIMLAGFSVPFRDVMADQTRAYLEKGGTPAQEIPAVASYLERILDLAEQGNDPATVRAQIADLTRNLDPGVKSLLSRNKEQGIWQNPERCSSFWYLAAMKLRPGEILSRVRCPSLALFGGNDVQIDAAKNTAALVAVLPSGHPGWEIRTLPQLNHGFQTSITGAESEYARLEETVAPVALASVTRWLDTLNRP